MSILFLFFTFLSSCLGILLLDAPPRHGWLLSAPMGWASLRTRALWTSLGGTLSLLMLEGLMEPLVLIWASLHHLGTPWTTIALIVLALTLVETGSALARRSRAQSLPLAWLRHAVPVLVLWYLFFTMLR